MGRPRSHHHEVCLVAENGGRRSNLTVFVGGGHCPTTMSFMVGSPSCRCRSPSGQGSTEERFHEGVFPPFGGP